MSFDSTVLFRSDWAQRMYAVSYPILTCGRWDLEGRKEKGRGKELEDNRR